MEHECIDGEITSLEEWILNPKYDDNLNEGISGEIVEESDVNNTTIELVKGKEDDDSTTLSVVRGMLMEEASIRDVRNLVKTRKPCF